MILKFISLSTSLELFRHLNTIRISIKLSLMTQVNNSLFSFYSTKKVIGTYSILLTYIDKA